MRLIFTIILSLSLIACGGGDEENNNDILVKDNTKETDINNPQLRYTIARTTKISPGEQCSAGGVEINSGVDENNNKRLDDTEILETQVVCHGTSGYNSLVDINDEPIGENCAAGGKSISTGLDANQNNILDSSEIKETTYVCNGLSGASGTTDGAAGYNSLVDISDELDGENCVNGGKKISTGMDADRNDILDPSEINNTSYVCNGLDGNSDGTSGYNSLVDITDEPAGSNCAAGGKSISTGLDANQNSILDSSEIEKSSYVCNGQSGASSESGYNSLVDISDELVGTNCANGGKKITTGMDTNRNDTLDPSEIDNTSYVCNGADGNGGTTGSGYNSLVDIADEPAGSNCEAGGKSISTGLDANQNSILDSSEIEKSSYVCNGQSGASSESGYNSLVDISDELVGTNCANGGKKITTGMDINRNDTLDPSEIDNTSYVCNGADGNGGTTGSGYSSLVDIADESAGSNCTNGGKQISTGLDSNNNGTLDSSEVTNISYVCNGLDGVTSSAGVSCAITEGPNGEKILSCSDGTLIPVEGGVVYQSSTVNDISGGKQIVDSWNTSGGRNRYSFRNNHYQIEVLSGGELVFEIDSNASDYFYLVNSLDIVVTEVSNNRMSVNLSSGVYTLIAATYNPYEQANYVLNIYGDINVLGKVDPSVSKSAKEN